MSILKVNEITSQLNTALLQKELLTEQLEQVCDKVKALRNLLAGVELGRQAAAELAVTNVKVD